MTPSIAPPAMLDTPADIAAHAAASFVRRPRTVLDRFPASHPRGSWPAEEFAAEQRRAGQSVRVIMSLDEDAFLVVPA